MDYQVKNCHKFNKKFEVTYILSTVQQIEGRLLGFFFASVLSLISDKLHHNIVKAAVEVTSCRPVISTATFWFITNWITINVKTDA